MSSDNWTTCPQCVKILRDAKAIFVEKYYGKLDSELFLKISTEFDRKITHMTSGTGDKYEQNEALFSDIHESKEKISITPDESLEDILCSEDTGAPLSENVDYGVGEDLVAHVSYFASCEICGFMRRIIVPDKEE